MNVYQRIKQNMAAGGVMLLAAILINGCSEAATPAAEVAGFTATPIITTVTPPTQTPLPTPTPSQLSTPTNTPVPPTASPAPLPTDAPPPVATSKSEPATPADEGSLTGQVQVSETAITLPTYPMQDFLIEQVDPVYNIPVLYLNRPAYEAANPAPSPVDYKGVVLENAYLRLIFLPQLGGRLYSAVVKATGQEIFYHNPVVKPSRYGGLQPPEANWWLATGGMEWAYPIQEHGYRWGVPWEYSVSQDERSATITLSDTGPERVGVEVAVTLEGDSALFRVAPRLINNTAETVPVQFWLNAALTLSPDTMSPNTQFIVPSEQVEIHSRGASGWSVPDARSMSPWPVVGETNLSDYSQWTDYLGVFVPDTPIPFMGAYNPDTDLGVVRLVEPGTPPGHKLFAFSQAFFDRSYTDGDSQYFEIWGGANAGFWPDADVMVAPGETLGWQEQWWPLAGLEGLTWANQAAAVHIQSGEEAQLSALFSRPQAGEVVVTAGETVVLQAPFSADPATPLGWQLDRTAETLLQIQIVSSDGTILLDHCINC